LILDARYERVRETGVIVSQAVLIAIGIDWDGRRQVLAVELVNRESCPTTVGRNRTRSLTLLFRAQFSRALALRNRWFGDSLVGRRRRA
jgi:hypothetical protein